MVRKVSYLKDSQEVDFYLPKTQTIINVSYDISNPSTLRREIKSLKEFINSKNINKAYLVANSEEKEIDGIKILPLWKFILMGNSFTFN